MSFQLSPTPRLVLALVLAFMLCCGSMRARGEQPELVIQTGHAREVSCVSFSPDGRRWRPASSACLDSL